MPTQHRAVQPARPTTTANDHRFERGTTALEAAFVIPVLLYLVFGAIGIVGAVRDHATLADAVRVGGRAASIAGADPSADQLVLAELARATGDPGSSRVDVVVIWHAPGPGAPMPAGCDLSGSAPNTTSLGVGDGGVDAPGACNVYLRPGAPGGAFAMATGAAAQPPSWYFGCQGSADPGADHKVDCRWPGKNRRTATSSRLAEAPLPPDFVGVHVVVEHQITTIAPHTTIRLEEDVINLIEPTRYDA